MREKLWLAYLLFLSFFLNAFSATSAQERPLTARGVVQRIQEHVGIPWQKETVDTFKAGDPDTKVTGIAVTMMATFGVLQRAAASGANLIITHEPTFYNHLDDFTEIPQKQNDPVLAEKLALIKEHHLVVWRFHDHWHKRTPDGIEAGMTHALGWEAFQDKQNQYLFTIPETTLDKLAAVLKARLELHTMRVVGDPQMKVTRVALSPGSAGMQREIGALEKPDIQLLITGESREWETVEYTADAISEKKNKALIILGHIPSEQAGMEECTRWLKTFVSEVPINFVPAAQPFW
ncbi:MAG TPA: Nif3-like dinuclear metal center hexameric protein [Candidatus Dormibacteraeota bacterium]|nr:Nif3-like dinuclear metal center hexameric protein [Candidatus Dormibacteraeota bacterium]